MPNRLSEIKNRYTPIMDTRFDVPVHRHDLAWLLSEIARLMTEYDHDVAHALMLRNKEAQRADQAEALNKAYLIELKDYGKTVTRLNGRVGDLNIEIEELEERAEQAEARVKELEAKVKPLKEAVRSSMNELLKDCISPELQDYFDYVKQLKSQLSIAREGLERLGDNPTEYEKPKADCTIARETLEKMKGEGEWE